MTYIYTYLLVGLALWLISVRLDRVQYSPPALFDGHIGFDEDTLVHLLAITTLWPIILVGAVPKIVQHRRWLAYLASPEGRAEEQRLKKERILKSLEPNIPIDALTDELEEEFLDQYKKMTEWDLMQSFLSKIQDGDKIMRYRMGNFSKLSGRSGIAITRGAEVVAKIELVKN
jgi:hypothetical protein